MKHIPVTLGRSDVTSVTFANDQPFVVIAGPCALESREHAHMMASSLVEICREVGVPLVYKTSFDKANRTSVKAYRGMPIEEALDIFKDIRQTYKVPVITDVHSPEQCAQVSSGVDALQLPAFLCRQTDLLIAAGETGLPINVKKGQFLAPWDMKNVATKIASTGNQNIMLCERGVSFGYNTLVNDMRALPIMAETGYPVVFDATHSVQQPGGRGDSTGGDRQYVEPLARSAVAVGVAGIFMETHQDPDSAPSDGPNMVYLKDMKSLLIKLKSIDNLVKGL